MDRQTAADLLDNLVGMVDDTQGNNYDDALKMGIEALRADADLISRQAAVSICDNAIDLWNGQLGVGALVAVRDAIKALPSAQPERKTGRWIDKDGGIATCSECGDRWGVWSVMKYCPNCGAKMEVEHEISD